MTEPEPTITLGDEALTDAEQEVLVMVWVAEAVGVCPSFHWPEASGYKATAEVLVRRGLCFRVRGAVEPGDDPEEAGYALQGRKANWIAETLFMASGLEIRDFIPE